MLQRIQLIVACTAALFVSACSAAPQITATARGGMVQVCWNQPTTSSWLFGFLTYSRGVQSDFWLFAEDAAGFKDLSGLPLSAEPPDLSVALFGPDLQVIGTVNGLPVSLHGGALLIGSHDFGPVVAGDTVEIRTAGVVVSAEFRGELPKS